MAPLRIETATGFGPLCVPSRYKGIYGGRGSGKSHFFAELLIDRAVSEPGLRAVCIREVQKDLRHSAKRLIEDKLEFFGIGEEQGFIVSREVISAPGDGIVIFQGMVDHTSESIKSLEGFDVAWVEEAQSLSATSLQLLRPTLRKPGSELWFSWNPRRKTDPVDKLLRGEEIPTSSTVMRANWDQNPWFPEELEQERLDCLRITPEQYDHIWEGGYATVLSGAYYASSLADARRQGRIGMVSPDPLMERKAFWDIGIRDATAIWIAQFVGTQIRVLDYYEASGQPLAAHLDWLRRNGYANARCYLPHDGINRDQYSAIRFVDHVRQAGFAAEDPMKNQGAQSDMKRVEAARRRFPSMWFNEVTTQAGLDALGWYHERQDENRTIGLGPEHDWASHAADAFGLMALYYEPPTPVPENTRRKALARSLV